MRRQKNTIIYRHSHPDGHDLVQTKNRTGEVKNQKTGKARKVAAFLLFEFVFCLFTGPLLLLFGPFQNVKRLVVGTFWATFRHQYVVKAFLSDEAVNRIVRSGFGEEQTEIEKMDPNLINLTDTHSDKIEVYSIESAYVKGKLIVVHDPRRVILGYSLDIPNSGKTTSEIVRDFGGIAGINGAGFLDVNYVGNGGVADGLLIHDGEVVFNNMPTVYNPADPASVRDFVGIERDGRLLVGWRQTYDQIMSYNLKEGLSFGPPLIVNGQKTILWGDGGWGIAPRTAIGQRATGEILLLVLDGRSGRTLGATHKDAQDILYEHGAVNAANLDGGASTTMVYKNKVINVPSDAMGERSIPAGFVVLPPIGDEEGNGG